MSDIEEKVSELLSSLDSFTDALICNNDKYQPYTTKYHSDEFLVRVFPYMNDRRRHYFINDFIGILNRHHVPREDIVIENVIMDYLWTK